MINDETDKILSKPSVPSDKEKNVSIVPESGADEGSLGSKQER